MVHSSLQFTLAGANQPHFGPRLGALVLHRPNGNTITFDTPILLTPTSRGVVPHLSRDHVRQTKAIGWVNVPFETFLEHYPPVPTLQRGPHALHRFLGFVPGQHLMSMSARDPGDVRAMPPNGNNHVSVYSLRGVRKITPAEWRTYTAACQPDVVFALSDTPYTPPPFSQKRLTKSIERSAAWLASLLAPVPAPASASTSASTPLATPTDTTAPETKPPRNHDPTPTPAATPAIFVHLAGAASHPARAAFAASLTEPLHGPERAAAGGHPCLDAGVSGYVLDLAPLRLAASVSAAAPSPSVSVLVSAVTDASSTSVALSSDTAVDVASHIPAHIPAPPSSSSAPLTSLIQTSLLPLPGPKPRLVTGTRGPHEVLRLVRDVGVEGVEAGWALEAAGCGVALDFGFPVREGVGEVDIGDERKEGTERKEGKRELGRNLYEGRYALDFGGLLGAEGERCVCRACEPGEPSMRVVDEADADAFEEGGTGDGEEGKGERKEGYTRAYVHHLLHTHEMGAHALLVMHNLAVVDAFLGGVRRVLAGAAGGGAADGAKGEGRRNFEEEVRRFEEVYSEEGRAMEEARAMWREVDLARGKGRLARERERLAAEEGETGG